jgi:hypothetical protein
VTPPSFAKTTERQGGESSFVPVKHRDFGGTSRTRHDFQGVI